MLHSYRPTGYHDLASLFQAVSLTDFLFVKKLPSSSTKDEMTCSDNSLSIDDKYVHDMITPHSNWPNLII